MSTTWKEQAWQSGLVLLNETEEWNEHDWPPLMGGWRYRHATVVLDHPDTDGNDNNPKRQTVVVMGGRQHGEYVTNSVNSVLLLNLAESNKQWREGPLMNQKRSGHAAVVCNGAVYVMGGYSEGSCLNCIERIDAFDLSRALSTSSTLQESQWTTLTTRLSTRRDGCCAVAVHNRYIVVMGGWESNRYVSSVDIIDTIHNHTVTAGPSLNVARSFCASAVIGHRIFVVGGQNYYDPLDSVEYLDFAKDDSSTTAISFSFNTWMTHSDLVLSDPRTNCAVVAVGACLVVAGDNRPVHVLDTHRNRVWNLLPFEHRLDRCSMVTVANQVAVIGGIRNYTCATFSLMDKNTWCFSRLCEQHPNDCFYSRKGRGTIQDADRSSPWTGARKRARPTTHRGD